MTTAQRSITGRVALLKLRSPDLPARIRALRFNATELNGGLGDIGVMAPIVAVLIADNGFNATSVLLVFGITYCVTGLYFGVPVPVQPLKAMAAIAIAQGLSAEVVSAAGLLMAGVLLVLAFGGLMRPLSSLFTRPVVRGIQLALGIMLVRSALNLAGTGSFVRGGPELGFSVRDVAFPAGLVIAGVLLLVILAGRRASVPVILLILPPAFLAGIVSFPSALPGLEIGPQAPQIGLATPSTFLTAAFLLVLPQLPLTLGNAVVASTDTARGYYGERASRVSHRSMLVSKGVANAFAGFIGGMPVCHGAGGITAHYRFGARTGGATVMFGAILIVLALGFGAAAGQLLALLPLSVVGALLAFVGMEHALLARDVRGVREVSVVATIVATSVLAGNLAIGFGAGIVLDLVLRTMCLPMRGQIEATLPAAEADPA